MKNVDEQELRTRIANAANTGELEPLEEELAFQRPDVVLRLAQLIWRSRRDLLAANGDQAGAREADLAALVLGAELVRRIEAPVEGSGFFRPWWDGGGYLDTVFVDVRTDLFARLWAAVQNASINPIVRSVYALAIWELQHVWKKSKDPRCPSKPEVTAAAIPVLASAAAIFMTMPEEHRFRGMEACPFFENAFYLGCLFKRFDLLAPVLVDLRAAILELEQEAPHWALALARSEVHLARAEGPDARNLVPEQRLRELLDWFREIDRRLREQDLLDVSMHLVDDVERVERMLGQPPDAAELARRRASVHVYRATHHRSAMARGSAWLAAAALYQDAGLKVEAANAKASSRREMQQSHDSDDTHTKVVQMSIDVAQLDLALAPIFDGATTLAMVLANLANWPLAPALVNPETALKEGGSVLASLVTQMRVVDDRIVDSTAGHAAGDDSFEIKQVMMQQVTMACAWYLPRIFQRIEEAHPEVFAAIIEVVAAAPCATPDDRLFMERGVRSLLEGDAVSAVHVLVPRVEQLVRRHLIGRGIDGSVLKDGGLQERTFGELLRVGAKVLPAWVGRLFRATLTEDWGLNLRNKIAHGLAKEADCVPVMGLLMVYLLLVVAGRSTVAVDRDPSAPAS